MRWPNVLESKDPMMDKLTLRSQSLNPDVSVSFAAANVRTLHTNAHESADYHAHNVSAAQLTSGRRLDLAIQFEAAKMHIIGLCETR